MVKEAPVDTSAQEENEVHDNSLEQSLSGDIPPDLNLAALELRAIQKIQDYAGYIDIISDSAYDGTFRDQALSMANDLFIDGRIIDSSISNTSESQNIKHFFNQLFNNKYGKVKPKIKDIAVIHHFTPIGNERYEALLSFNQIIENIETKKEIKVILTKVEKQFGSSKKEVWVVFLGDIR